MQAPPLGLGKEQQIEKEEKSVHGPESFSEIQPQDLTAQNPLLRNSAKDKQVDALEAPSEDPLKELTVRDPLLGIYAKEQKSEKENKSADAIASTSGDQPQYLTEPKDLPVGDPLLRTSQKEKQADNSTDALESTLGDQPQEAEVLPISSSLRPTSDDRPLPPLRVSMPQRVLLFLCP